MARGVVGVTHIEPHDEGGLVLLRARLQQISLSVSHLDGIGLCPDQRIDHARHVLKAHHEGGFVAHPMVNGHVEAASIGEQAVHACLRADLHHSLLENSGVDPVIVDKLRRKA